MAFTASAALLGVHHRTERERPVQDVIFIGLTLGSSVRRADGWPRTTFVW
jgi:hypothetical protein